MTPATRNPAWNRPNDPLKRGWLGVPGWLRFALHVLTARREAARRPGAVEPKPPTPTPTLALGGPARIVASPSVPAAQADGPPAGASLAARMDACRAGLLDSHVEGQLTAARAEGAIALVSEIAAQVLGLSPKPAQREAASAMLQRHLVQLAPGEGKTLAIAMVAVIHAWRHRPVHVVTANDYLAQRDAVLMAPLYEFCGLSVSWMTGEDPPEDAAGRYRADVVYATANQLLADFLRDDLLVDGADTHAHRLLWSFRQAPGAQQPVLPGLATAIIDEADSVLIDEATTPLIISYAEQDRADYLGAVALAHEAARELRPVRDYELVVLPSPSIRFTDEGRLRLHQLARSLSAYWQREGRCEELFKTVITAREFFIRDQDYILREESVVIIDGHTGRASPGRQWSNGIHQAIEAKENVALTVPTKTVARMTFQSFFRRYHTLCGASGTLHGLDLELWSTYGVKVRRIAPHAPSRLRIERYRVHATENDKFAALVDAADEFHRRGLPVLIGTRRIEDSERIATALGRRGLACTTLNAKQHQYEAEIIARAGRRGALTVATDMAGRGTDILLDEGVEALGGLQVLMFEAHESARVDWQLFGRAGRQGAPGTAIPYLALDDEMLQRYLPRALRWLARRSHERLGSQRLPVLALRVAQWRAQRHAIFQRKQLNRVQNELRKRLSFVRDA